MIDSYSIDAGVNMYTTRVLKPYKLYTIF